MKQMVYKTQWEHELLEYNTYMGYNYAVISQGLFLCGYVEIPPDYPCQRENIRSLGIMCHGGITFTGNCLEDLGISPDTFWIGWDYGHGYDLRDARALAFHEYTTGDVVIECQRVINQLIALRGKLS